MEPSYDCYEYVKRLSDPGLEDWRLSMHQGYDFSESVPTKKQMIFSWCDMNVYTKDPNKNSKSCSILPLCNGNSGESVPQKHILKNVNGVAYPGELLVIMGSSGAGKTTLLNCMTFRNLKNLEVSGLICINNQAVNQIELASQSAYVQQDDLFIRYLTVKEHLTFQSKVRMPSCCTDDEREARVEKIMEELSLKKCENSQIGQPGVIKGISGGERKRLAFASELLTNPSLLFCDEPTTGLDSYMSYNVVQMMKDLARTGRTIITTLHQPSSELFHTFDKLCLMADGRTAFLGSLPEADTFFSSIQLPCPKTYNPSDHYIQVLSVVPDREEISKRSVNRICDAFQMSETGMKIKKSSKTTMKAAQDKAKRLAHNKRGHITPYRVGWYDQMKALFPRSWLSVLQNPYATKYKAITVILETSLITLIYYGQVLNQLGIKNLDGVIYFLVFSISFQNIFGVIDTFCEELPIFLKEHKDGMYRTDTYYVTKMISDMPFPLIFAFTSTIICYYLVGLNPDFHKFLMALFICFLISQAAQGEGYVISTLAPNIHLAVILVSVLTLPLLIFGGIFLSSKSVPRWLQWVADLSYFKYGYDALMINQWDDINYIPCKTNSTSCINDGLMVLDSVSIDLGEKWPCIIALIVLAIGFRVIAYFILLYKAYFKD